MKNRIYFLLIFLAFSCNPGGNITRTLRFVDLGANENNTFQLYPNEFSYYILNAVLTNDIDGYYIDYVTNATISPLTPDTLLSILTENFYDDEIDVESAGSYLSEANLISLDEISVGGNYHSTNFITFYFPGEATPEGMDKQFCSVSFEDALDVLENQDPPVVWFQFANPDWGWINNEVFQPDYLSSNQLGNALIKHHITDTTFLTTSLRPEQLKVIASDERFIFSTTISNNGIGEIYFQNDASSLLLGQFTSEHLQQLHIPANDSLWILPMALAFELQLFKSAKDLLISENGAFPGGGADELSSKVNKKNKPGKSPFKSSQRFKYKAVERIVTEDRPDVVEKILNAVRHGEISVFHSDSLKTKKSSGKFFDELVIEDLENIKLVDQSLIEVGLVVKEIQFDMDGNAEQQIKGFGLIVPGKHVPEGFDRTLGFFELGDLEKIIKINAPIRGLPLYSGNIEAAK